MNRLKQKINKMSNKERKVFYTASVVLFLLVLLNIFGLSFAFFTALITGNDTAKSAVVETGSLSIVYTNSNELRGTNVMPGWTETKTFTVENTGTVKATYNINWNNLLNEFINKEDLVYTITSDNNGGTLTETILPDSGEHIGIIDSIDIEPGVIQTYTLTVTYKNREEEQIVDHNKKLIGKIEVLDSNEQIPTEYKVNVNVENGTSDKSELKVKRKEDAILNLTPNDAYGDPVVSCTNNQNATIKNDILTINTITDNTTCTVTYKKIFVLRGTATQAIQTYNVSNNVGLIRINQPATIQTKATTEYRYSGNNDIVKNYVKFNNEIWRIIGIFDVDNGTGKIEKRVKILRETSIGNYSWDSSASSINSGNGSNQWGPSGSYPGADLMRELNDTYYNAKSGTCYNNSSNGSTTCNFTTTGLKEESRKMIDNAKWYTGASTYESTTSQQSYIKERSNKVGTTDSGQSITKTSNWTGKIAIMYPSDYGYGSSSCYISTALYNYNASTCVNSNWLKGLNEWPLAPYESYNYYALYVNGSGSITANYMYAARATRPTLYLKSSVKITKGSGASTDPYELSL